MAKAKANSTARADASEGPAPAAPRSSWAMVLPLGIFIALAGLFYLGLHSGDPSKLPSVLIGKPVPEFSLPPLEGLKTREGNVPGFTSGDLAKGEVTIVNVWASWCIPCHQEHPFLSKLRDQAGAPLFGMNYKDQTAAARRFLGRYGNPFQAVGVDAKGQTAIDWGVYGVPETFVVDGKGRIAYKHVGPINDTVIATKLLPAIRAARKAE